MNARLETLLGLTRRLTALVEAEIGLIEARRIGGIAAHEDERAKLTGLYAREMQALKADAPRLKATLDPAEIEAVKAETRRFDAALDRHRRLVERMRRVTEGIVKAVADEAMRAQAPRKGYGPSGAVAPAPRSATLAINAKA